MGLPVMFGPVELDQYNVARAKTVQECEQRRYRSAIRLLLAFAKQAGIEASSLLTAPNETVVLCIEGALKAALDTSFPVKTPPPAPASADCQEDGSGGGEKKLKASREKAYRLFLWAMEQNPSLKRDQDVYDWLNERPELPDDLPNFDTWSKYLREARDYHDDHKRTPRITKEVRGKSVVHRDRI